jgi:hypothetical protein
LSSDNLFQKIQNIINKNIYLPSVKILSPAPGEVAVGLAEKGIPVSPT